MGEGLLRGQTLPTRQEGHEPNMTLTEKVLKTSWEKGFLAFGLQKRKQHYCWSRSKYEIPENTHKHNIFLLKILVSSKAPMTQVSIAM